MMAAELVAGSFGDIRVERMVAQFAAVVVNAWKGKGQSDIEPADFLKFNEPQPVTEATPEEFSDYDKAQMQKQIATARQLAASYAASKTEKS